MLWSWASVGGRAGPGFGASSAHGHSGGVGWAGGWLGGLREAGRGMGQRGGYEDQTHSTASMLHCQLLDNAYGGGGHGWGFGVGEGGDPNP